MSPFAQVKTSKYGVYRAKERCGLWSEEEWKRRVLLALLGISDMTLRRIIAGLCSFRYTLKQLSNKLEVRDA